jgi:hypothetical protein
MTIPSTPSEERQPQDAASWAQQATTFNIKSAYIVIIQISTTEEKSIRKKFICLAS